MEKVLSSSSTNHLYSRLASFIALCKDSFDDDAVLVCICCHSFMSKSSCEPSFAALLLESLTLSKPSTPSIGRTMDGSILKCLKKLAAPFGNKNILKKLNYEKVRSKLFDHLLPKFDGNFVFKFLRATTHSFAKSMQNMDKSYDGRVWTKTIITNVLNDMGLACRPSLCIGHLQCANKDCDYLKCTDRTSPVNDTEFKGSTWKPFFVGQEPPKESTLVCKVCKEPSKCVKDYCAGIIYVHGRANMTRACIHLGYHLHPVKVGDYRDTKFENQHTYWEQIEKSPSTKKSAIVLEASKELLGEYLLRDEDERPKTFNLNEFLYVPDKFKDMGSLNIRNKVVTFRYLRRYGVMDSKITEFMEDQERTCFFHWSQSIEKHNKQYIAKEFRDHHKCQYMEYRDFSTIAKAETRYLAIRAWWLSSEATSETSLTKLDLWLVLWHF